MFRRLLAISAIFGALLIPARTGSAQTNPPPNSLRGVILNWGLAQAPPGAGGNPQLFSTLGALEEVIGLQVSTAPLGSSTGGFAFVFDQNLQSWRPSTTSFGPAFAQRSLTTQKGNLSVGFNFLHAGYNSLAGLDLANGDLKPVQNAQTPASNISSSVVKASVSSNTTVVFAILGVTDDLDIGIAVPVVSVSFGADQAFFSAAGVDLSAGRHAVVPTTTSSGVGDVAIFAKYHFWHHNKGGLAAGLEVQVPSGDTDNLRGAGVGRTLVSAIWSQGGKVSPHANVGYEFWSSAAPIATDGSVFAKNQVRYAFGLEFAAHPKATVMLDLVGRRLLHGGQLGYVTLPSPFAGGGTFQGLVPLSNGINDISLAPGIKVNVWRKLLLTTSVLGSLANGGMRANLTPVVGLDLAF